MLFWGAVLWKRLEFWAGKAIECWEVSGRPGVSAPAGACSFSKESELVPLLSFPPSLGWILSLFLVLNSFFIAVALKQALPAYSPLLASLLQQPINSMGGRQLAGSNKKGKEYFKRKRQFCF